MGSEGSDVIICQYALWSFHKYVLYYVFIFLLPGEGWTKVFTVLHTEPCRLYIGLFLYESMSSAGYRSSPISPLWCWEPLLNIRISSKSNTVLCTVVIKIKINRNLPNICRIGVMFLLGAFCLSWTWIWRILNLSCVTRWLSAVHLSFCIFTIT